MSRKKSTTGTVTLYNRQGKSASIPAFNVAEYEKLGWTRQAPTPLQRVPKDANGEPKFEATDHETAWDALVEYSEGDAVTAKEIADAMVEEKKKALDKAQKLKIKGKTPAEMLASKKANAAELDKAQKEFEQWQRIASVEHGRKDAEVRAAQAEMRQRAAERAAQEAAERAAREEAERIEREGLGGERVAEGAEPAERGGRATGESRGSKDSRENRSLSKEESIALISEMEEGAGVAPQIELTVENRDSLFGKDGIVATPIGDVKMGEHQFLKMMREGRNSKLGMIKPTLEKPSVIIEVGSEAKDGKEAERSTSYVFVRSFKKADGSRFYYFTAISVSIDSKEVVVSNQEKSRNKIVRLLMEGSVIWRAPKDATASSAEKQGLDYAHPKETEGESKGSGITPQSTSTGKGIDFAEEKQGEGGESSPTEWESKAEAEYMRSGAEATEPTEAQRMVGAAVSEMLRDAGIEVVTDESEMARVLGEQIPANIRADIEMMEEAKRKPLHRPASDKNAAPTLSGGVSRTKVEISDVNRKGLEEKVEAIHQSIASGMTGEDFLRVVKKAFGFDEADNADRSVYAVNEIGGVNHTMRVANHHADAKFYAANGELSDNTAVVIKMSDRRFRSKQGVSLVEYVYFPDKLTSEKMHGIVEGLKDWVERGEYTHTGFDDRKVSGYDNPLQAMTVWHGSPHEFEAFDSSKMGSGEGAQAHGWGHYVAMTESTGRGYAKSLGQDYGVRYIGSETDMYKRDALRDMAATMERGGLSFEDAKQRCLRLYGNRFEPTHKWKRQAIEESRKEDFETYRNLYEVEIPDDNGKNYLEERGYYPAEIDTLLARVSESTGVDMSRRDMMGSKVRQIDYDNPDFRWDFRYIYKYVAEKLGGEKAASEAFAKVGYVGIKYDGRVDGPCAVIFDEADLKIKSRTQFLRTSQGEVYGFVKDGKVYIDPKLMNPNTPIHEYTHLWDKALQKANPQLWARGKELMRQLPMWDEVVNDPAYAEIADDEDLVASEVHSRLSGKEGAELLERMVDESRGKGVFAQAHAVTLKERIKQWLSDMLGWVRDAFSGEWGNKDLQSLTIEEFAAMPVRDLAIGFNPKEVLGKSKKSEAKDEKDEKIANFAAEEIVEKIDDVFWEGTSAKDRISAVKYLQGSAEGRELIERLHRHSGTPWAKAAANSVLVRMSLEDMLAGRKPRVQSMLTAPDSRGKVHGVVKLIQRHGADGVWHYLIDKGIIGNAAKCVNNVNGSYLSCHPSDNCARFCYASQGNSASRNSIVKNELIRWAVQTDPKRVADMIARQYMAKGEWLLDDGKALRLFEAGDLDESWLPVIEELNRRGIVTQIFSKNPKVLERVDRGKNVVMMSVDASNLHLLDENPDMPIAFVYASKSDLPALEKCRGRFEKHGGVILPVVEGNKVLSAEDLKGLPQWTHRYQCPIDNGQRKIVNKKHPELAWNCTKCDSRGGVGCFFHRTAKQLKDRANDLRRNDLRGGDGGVRLSASPRNAESVLGGDEALSNSKESARRSEVRGRLLRIFRAHGIPDALITPELLEDVDSGLRGDMGSWRSEANTAGVSEGSSEPAGVSGRTDSAGSGSERGSGIEFQILGERGARELDRRDGTTERMDNLKEAQEMERGFEEKKRRIEKLRHSEPLIFTGKEFEGIYELNPRSATQYILDNLRGEYINKDTGDKIKVSRKGAEKVMHHDVESDIHLQSVAYIPAMLSESIFIDEIANEKGKNSYDSYRYYVVGLNIGGEDYTAKLAIGVKGGKTYYDHALTQINKNNLLAAIDPIKSGFGSKEVSGVKDKWLVSLLQTNNAENAKKIKLATGWERGADGKWRYEATDNGSEDVAREGQIFLEEPLGDRGAESGERADDRAPEILEREGEGARSDDEVSYANDPIARVLGKSHRRPGQRRAFAGRERRRMEARVRELVERLHLGNVEIVSDGSGLTGRKRRAKGFYNTRTGKICIVIGNHTSVEDAERTVLHEAVAHYGLRQLFGERFDTFLDNVYASADADVRREIDRLMREHGWDVRTATEEYLAQLAETTNFEHIDYGWWGKIKRLFVDMLGSLGFKGFDAMSLSDNELRYLLWRSYQNLAYPGKYRSIFAEAEDVAMQSELRVGNYSEEAGQAMSAAEDAADREAAELRRVSERFNAELQQQIEGTLPKGHIYHLGRPGAILRSTGVPDLPIELNSARLELKATSGRHDYDMVEVMGLVDSLQHPIAVFAYGDSKKAQNVVLEVSHNGKNFVVGISITPTVKGQKLEINSIRTVYPKDNHEWIKWITDGKLLYINKEKIQPILTQQRMTFADVDKIGLDLDSAAKIVKEFENPSMEAEDADEDGLLFRDGSPEARRRVTARSRYERRVKRRLFQTREALQDSMLGLREAMEAILRGEGKRGKQLHIEEVAGFENAYLGENALASVNQQEIEAMDRLLFKPLYKAAAKLARNEASRRELNDYMMAKHGLERNVVMAQREAEKEFADYQAAHPHGSKTLADFVAEKRQRDYAGLTALTGEADVVAAETAAQRIVATYEAAHDTTELWQRVSYGAKDRLI